MCDFVAIQCSVECAFLERVFSFQWDKSLYEELGYCVRQKRSETIDATGTKYTKGATLKARSCCEKQWSTLTRRSLEKIGNCCETVKIWNCWYERKLYCDMWLCCNTVFYCGCFFSKRAFGFRAEESLCEELEYCRRQRTSELIDTTEKCTREKLHWSVKFYCDLSQKEWSVLDRRSLCRRLGFCCEAEDIWSFNTTEAGQQMNLCCGGEFVAIQGSEVLLSEGVEDLEM